MFYVPNLTTPWLKLTFSIHQLVWLMIGNIILNKFQRLFDIFWLLIIICFLVFDSFLSDFFVPNIFFHLKLCSFYKKIGWDPTILWGLSSKGIALAPSSSSSRCLPVMLSLTLWGKEDSCSRNSFIHGCSIAYFAESLYSGSNSIQH